MNSRTHPAAAMVPLVASRFPPFATSDHAKHIAIVGAKTPNSEEVPPAFGSRMSKSFPRPVDLLVFERANNQQATRLVTGETRPFMHPNPPIAATHARPSPFVSKSAQIPGHALTPKPYGRFTGTPHGKVLPCEPLHRPPTLTDSPSGHSIHMTRRQTRPTPNSTMAPRRPLAAQIRSVTSSTCHRAHMLPIPFTGIPQSHRSCFLPHETDGAISRKAPSCFRFVPATTTTDPNWENPNNGPR